MKGGAKPTLIDLQEYRSEIIANFSFQNQYQADRVLKKHYETTFGIFNHRSEDVRRNKPLAGMALLPGNSPGKHYIYEYMIQEYHDCRVKDILGMTFMEFIQLPIYDMQQLKAQCRKINGEAERLKAAEADAMNKILNNSGKGNNSSGKGLKDPSGIIPK